jgi:hypothetical protein
VHDTVDSTENAGERAAVGDVADSEVDLGGSDPSRAVTLVNQHAGLLAPFQQQLGHVAAEEPSRTGDQDRHAG